MIQNLFMRMSDENYFPLLPAPVKFFSSRSGQNFSVPPRTVTILSPLTVKMVPPAPGNCVTAAPMTIPGWIPSKVGRIKNNFPVLGAAKKNFGWSGRLETLNRTGRATLNPERGEAEYFRSAHAKCISPAPPGQTYLTCPSR